MIVSTRVRGLHATGGTDGRVYPPQWPSLCWDQCKRLRPAQEGMRGDWWCVLRTWNPHLQSLTDLNRACGYALCRCMYNRLLHHQGDV
jgi:hypothetical protein